GRARSMRNGPHVRGALHRGPMGARSLCLLAAITRGGSGQALPAQVQERSCLVSGSERTRFPVAAKIALHTAGRTGGRAGSPSPLGENWVFRKETSTGTEWGMRSIGYW